MSCYTQVGLTDLLDHKKVRMAYRKSLLSVHPDKLPTDCPAEHKVAREGHTRTRT